MIEGIQPLTPALSDTVEAAIRNIEFFLYNVEYYDEASELLSKYALPQLKCVAEELIVAGLMVRQTAWMPTEPTE
jgi:hypothetical protein